MSQKKSPNAVVVSAQRLQDLRDLCQPSNFNTVEQAHDALHDGISKLLNEESGIDIDIHRLIVGDKFYVTELPDVWSVDDILCKFDISVRMSENTGKVTADPSRHSDTMLVCSTSDGRQAIFNPSLKVMTDLKLGSFLTSDIRTVKLITKL